MSRWNADLVGELPPAASPVVGSDHVVTDDSVDAGELPDTVFVPTEQLYVDAAQEVVLELRALEGGRIAMLVFTSLMRLVGGCGEGQPWVAVQANMIPAMQAYTEADTVIVDAELPAELRRTVTGGAR
jgi:hypothetical protein